MNRWWLYLSIVMIWAVVGGCSNKSNDDIVVIIEDATWDNSGSHPSDTSAKHVDTSSSNTHNPPSDRRTVSLSGAVRLLKNDLESGDTKILSRHCEILLKTVEAEVKKSTDTERTRALNIFYLKLSGVDRSVKAFKSQKIPPTERVNLLPVLDELNTLARRIEGRD